MKGKAALVTGASRGIGKAISLALASCGAQIVAFARTEDALQATADEIRSAGGEAAVVVGDLSDPAAGDRAVQMSIEAFGRLDILVNNAGVTRDGLLIRMKDEDWDSVIGTNLTGAFRFTRAAARTMMKQRSGRVIQISSVVGVKGNAGQANYAASKAGVIGMTLSLAKELGPRGVTVNAIAPGFITTDMTSGLSEDYQSQLRNMIPLGVFGSPEDVAAVACFLASDEARYVTGQVIQVDGGMRL
ncbi:3-oxoacyl-[acyl-carrier-protein] reductase [Candidatus Poribacteria bacterium]|nr:3-oxoacyl-[acyl-carrier-protein] reductase [Candidatus Poribacteria bacterium]